MLIFKIYLYLLITLTITIFSCTKLRQKEFTNISSSDRDSIHMYNDVVNKLRVFVSQCSGKDIFEKKIKVLINDFNVAAYDSSYFLPVDINVKLISIIDSTKTEKVQRNPSYGKYFYQLYDFSKKESDLENIDGNVSIDINVIISKGQVTTSDNQYVIEVSPFYRQEWGYIVLAKFIGFEEYPDTDLFLELRENEHGNYYVQSIKQVLEFCNDLNFEFRK